MKNAVETYRALNYEYDESFISANFWNPLLRCIIFPGLILISEYKMTELKPTYPNLKIDLCVCRNRKKHPLFCDPKNPINAQAEPRIPLLLIEISRDSLKSNINPHKDQEKVAIGMAAGMNKIFSLTWGRGKAFLSQLKVYGLLCGGTDFEICRLYPVFEEDSDNFYFVFESSKKLLRFRIVEENEEITSIYLNGIAEQQISCTELFKYRHPENETFTVTDPLTQELETQLEMEIIDEMGKEQQEYENQRESKQSKKAPNNEVIEDEYMFENGFVNDESLIVLEKLLGLVKIQADLICDLNPKDINPAIKYPESRIKLMDQGRATHNAFSPEKRRYEIYEATINSPSQRSKIDLGILKQFIDSLSLDIDKENLIPSAPGDQNGKGKAAEIYSKFKGQSPHELDIYSKSKIKDSPHFPLLMSHEVYPDKKQIRLELEEVIPLAIFSGQTGEIGAWGCLVDLMGALRSLHSVGYLHGDLSPGNVGFNSKNGIWQLFDFDSSCTIEEGTTVEGQSYYRGTKNFISPHYDETGRYLPWDDYCSLALTLKFAISSSSKNPFNVSSASKNTFVGFLGQLFAESTEPIEDHAVLDQLYFEAVQRLWGLCKPDIENPSIQAAVPLLKEIMNSKNQ